MAVGYRKTSDLPEILAIFPLDGALLLPGGVLPLQIFEPRYLNMIDDAMRGDRLIGMIQTLEGGPRDAPALREVGCAGRITSYSETGDGKYLIALSGVCRFAVIEEAEVRTPYRQVRADFRRFEPDLAEDDETVEFERARFLDLLRRFLDRRQLGVEWDVIHSAPAPALINSLSMALPFSPVEKQALLEAPDLDGRRHALTALLEIDGAFGGEGDDAPSIQ
jgi:Lon protease-like protein